MSVTMADAPRVIGAMVAGRGSVVVAISGPVGSGKSTLARAVSGCVLSTDDYLPDYDRVPYAERDLPERMDSGLLVEHLMQLRSGRAVQAPVWSFQTHSRVGTRQVEPAEVVLCEGIHALVAVVAKAADVRVFVDAPAGVRWARWQALEERGERGWGVELARTFFEEVAEPTFAARAAGYRACADVVVLNP